MFRLSVFAAALFASVAAHAATPETEALYRQHCGECHGNDRLGGMGPALLPENLARLRKPAAAELIAKGRQQTQMPAFGDKLSAEQVQGLVEMIYEPLPQMPVWGQAEILASHKIVTPPEELPGKPVFQADMLNLFVVVEMGDSHITLFDGDKLEPITRFPSHFALHGGPKYSPDGRFIYFVSRDGWVTKYDTYSLKVVADVRAGINTRNLAVSGDGKTVAVANYLPHTLVLLDAADLKPIKIIEVTDKKKTRSSRVSAVYQAEPRDSFVVALKDLPEMWVINWTDNPPPIYEGMVHTYEFNEALPIKGKFPVRRIELKEPMDDFFFDQSYDHVIGSARDGGRAAVVHLDVRREIKSVPQPGLPHLGSGITWTAADGRKLMATPNLKDGNVSVIDVQEWTLVKTIPTLGPGIFMRSHENTPYAWVDNSFSKFKDTLQIIDKRSLEVVRQIVPEPGKTANHVEFTRDGKYALVSVSEDDGWLVIYDAATFAEVKRIPMRKPMGKYNVFNKITRSGGTSH
jgi:DNA-binding beta-propeller fold protein YncE/cytochrome c553